VARDARRQIGGEEPKLAIAFVASAPKDLEGVFTTLRAELGSVPILGGTAAGAVFGPSGVHREGVSLALLAGDFETATSAVRLATENRFEVVPAAERLAAMADLAAARGHSEFTCLAFAPAVSAMGDGDLLVAAVRKGVGPRARLAGAMTGDVTTFGAAPVFAGDQVSLEHAVLAGIFSRSPFGVAARHGWSPVGKVRRVTCSDGAWLISLDGKPAFDVWADGARAAGGDVPRGRTQAAAIYLAKRFALDVRSGDRGEPVVRIPMAVRADGAVRLSGSIGEAAGTRIVRGTRKALIDAATLAARTAAADAGGDLAGGIALACGGRLSVLGDEFSAEAGQVARVLRAPVAGACVFGEIARGRREVEAFHNGTIVVMAVPRGT